MNGRIYIISTGPGAVEWMPAPAIDTLYHSDVIIGYKTYLKPLSHLCADIPRICSDMRHERERAAEAIRLAAAGQRVAVISGGDAGIYGMAGLVLEALEESGLIDTIDASILPGISALNAAASLLGAPLMADFAAVSLSDYQIPLDVILSRVKAVVTTGFVLCLYNPRSHIRTIPYESILELLEELLPPEIPVGLAENAFRENQHTEIFPLSELPQKHVTMNTILIIGTNQTRILGGRMVTPRGFSNTKEETAL